MQKPALHYADSFDNPLCGVIDTEITICWSEVSCIHCLDKYDGPDWTQEEMTAGVSVQERMRGVRAR